MSKNQLEKGWVARAIFVSKNWFFFCMMGSFGQFCSFDLFFLVPSLTPAFELDPRILIHVPFRQASHIGWSYGLLGLRPFAFFASSLQALRRDVRRRGAGGTDSATGGAVLHECRGRWSDSTPQGQSSCWCVYFFKLLECQLLILERCFCTFFCFRTLNYSTKQKILLMHQIFEYFHYRRIIFLMIFFPKE